VQAGRSPLGPIWLPAKTVRVRALPEDPRHFDDASDATQATIRPGGTARVFLDLRPRVMLRTAPEPAQVFRVALAGADSLLGETPLAVSPVLLEGNRFRFHASDHADTTVSGDSLLDIGQASGSARVSMRRVAQTLAAPARRPPVYRRPWLQWSLVGVGAGLTGAAALFRREGDQWYDRYLESSDRAVLDTYFNRAVRYDHLSLLSLGVGQVFFTGGLFLLVSGSGR